MHVSPRSLLGLAAGAVLFLAASPLPTVRAQSASREGAPVTVFLTDGFILQGTDRREGRYEIEGQDVVFLPTGGFFLDDGLRRQYFGSRLMREVKERPVTTEDKILGKQHPIAILNPKPIPTVDEVLSPPTTSWNDKWDRNIKFRSGFANLTVNQHLTELTPYYARTDATEHWSWPAVYQTRELGVDGLRDLLGSHPDFAPDKSLAPDVLAARRFHYCDFMAQTGYYDEAENELNRLVDDKPSKDVLAKAEATRAALGRLRTREQFETIKQMHNAGQFKAVRKKLAEFNDKAADAQTLVDFNTRRDEYKTADKVMADAVRFLDEASKSLPGGVYDSALREGAAAIQADLQPDVLPRLDTFLGQARQAERQIANHQAATAGPSQLLSLAITGWLGALPDPAPETAARLWRARQFLVKYLSADGRSRKPLLDDYLSDRNQATLDEITQLVPLLPPVEPEAKITADPVELTAGGQTKGAKYVVQLPPEYRLGRNYPVLFVLHQSGEAPADMLKRWGDLAALNGYILVAPEWANGLGGVYGFSEREHAVVLNTLRDLRRRFAVDSDRVFLFGMGEGGAMAFDVGLSHPDLFAGVLPMSAGPSQYSAHYYRNGQYLPFYMVSGRRSDAIHTSMRTQFEKWVSQYPMLWMEYKGRGVEWYGAEVPVMFDWMRGKQRQFPLQGVGVEKDPKTRLTRPFTTHRPTDNSFYWVSTDDIQLICQDLTANKPATISALIELESNTIFLETTGMKQATVWLGSNGKGETMVNFDKPVTVMWNGHTVWKNLQVTRRLDTLLDDLVQRGDRQRLFTAKLEFQTK